MEKFYKFILGLSVILMFVFGFSPSVNAMTPTLSLSTSGQSGDYVQVSVIGDPNVSVMLFIGSYTIPLGTTNSSGVLTTSIGSSLSENQVIVITSNSNVYIRTNGINGPQSSSVVWPYVSSTTGNLTLSQSALLLNIGQTSTITANANYLYVLSNSTPAVANINLNANQITVTANTYGSTVANICVVGSTTNCSNLTVTIQNSGSQQLTFSQNNFSVYSGQSVSVTVSGGSGSYLISNNSNSGAVQASLSGSTVTLTASSTTGSSSITVCTTDMTYCGIINVSASTVSSTAVSFSQTNPVVAIGQSMTVTIYGGTGNNFYVSSNSNPSIVQANINGNILTLIANAGTGTSTINICAYAGSCGSVTANVTSSVGSNGSISLSQSTVSILAGQSTNITILGGSTPYSMSSANSTNIFNSSINGNILTIYGVNPGYSSANICSSTGCTTLSVTVSNTNISSNPPTFSQNNVPLTIGQQATVYISGTGGYYISSNSNPTVASLQISGNSAIVSALTAGSTNVSICQSNGQCSILSAVISGSSNNLALSFSQNNLSLTAGQSSTVYLTGNGGYYLSNNSNPTVASLQISGNSAIVSALTAGSDSISICQTGGQCASLSVVVSVANNTNTNSQVNYTFPRYLGYGDKGDDVLQLQNLLKEKGYLLATPNGRYGPATKLAVQKFQKDNGIKQSGNVGPSTKNILNQLSASATTTKADQISSVQQAIQKLLAQVAQIQGQ